VSGQLCRVAEGLIYRAYALTHRHPPPSLQKSETCANPVSGLFQNLKRAARFLQGNVSFRVTFWTGNLAWSRPVQISTSKISCLAFCHFCLYSMSFLRRDKSSLGAPAKQSHLR
jgi:hypothetical protein